MYQHGNSKEFSINSEAIASELLENLEGIFIRFLMYSDVFDMFNISTTQYIVIRRERVEEVD